MYVSKHRENGQNTHRWYSESVFSVTPLDALAMEARQVEAKGPGFLSLRSSKSSAVRLGIVSHLPSRSSLMSSSRGLSPGCLARRARIRPENSLGTGGDMARKGRIDCRMRKGTWGLN